MPGHLKAVYLPEYRCLNNQSKNNGIYHLFNEIQSNKNISIVKTTLMESYFFIYIISG